MRASVNPTTAADLLDVEHAAVRALIDELTDAEMTHPDTIRYGLYPDQECSFKDLLAHLVCYEVFALEALAEWRRGKEHWILDALETRGREIHFAGIEDRRHSTLAEQLAEWERVQNAVTQAIRNISEQEWCGLAPYEDGESTDLGGMLERIIVAPPRPMYRHLPVHIPDSEAYIRSLRS